MGLPWLRFYGDVPTTLAYPDIGLYEALARSVSERPGATAVDFFGYELTFAELLASVDRCASGLAAHGVRRGDRITISTPTCPPGVIAFYAAAKLGAVSSMIHPLSTPDEIKGYLNVSSSRFAVTLDLFYGRFAEAREGTELETLVLARIEDYLSLPKKLGFWWKQGRKAPGVPDDDMVVRWSVLLQDGRAPQDAARVSADEMASILYSGGSTGTPKGIMLSHRNFVAEAMQVAAWVGLGEHDTVLGVLPIFHGFGLGALVNASLLAGAQVVMVPQYSPEIVAKLLRTTRPTLTAGPPTLFESLARDPSLATADLSSLRAAFCGADTLPVVVRERFEQFVADRGGSARLLEGYGLTEAVTAIMGMPLHERRDGSMGVPFPDMRAKICAPDTTDELLPGNEGEICISGPAVMLGYLGNPEATVDSLRTHADGRVWLHTGDIGRMDEDGFFTFVSRLKRMIKSSGFNVFPSQVEAVLYDHAQVVEACVIGVPDVKQGERVKAFVVVQDRDLEGSDLADELIAHCQERLIKWSCPRDVEFLPELPKTRLGKVDFSSLERRESTTRGTTGA